MESRGYGSCGCGRLLSGERFFGVEVVCEGALGLQDSPDIWCEFS